MKPIIKLFAIVFLFIGFHKNIQAQCDVTATAYSSAIAHAGDTIFLTSTGYCGILMNSNFNNYLIGPGWSSIPANAVFSNPCGPGPSGAYAWVGTTAAIQRSFVTIGFDVSIGGCVIKWDMRYGLVPGTGPCEDPDGVNEGVHLQYSTNGTTWFDFPGPNMYPVGPNTTTAPFSTTIKGSGGYWPPESSGAAQLTSSLYHWHSYECTVPYISATINTQFRWVQLVNSSTGFDTWGIDEVIISCPNSNTNVLWSNGDTVFTPGQVILPPHPQLLAYDTCFIVHVWDNLNPAGAYDTVCIHVLPVPVSNLGPDTSLCYSDTLLLNTQLDSNYYFIWTSNGDTLSTHLPYILTDSAGIYTVETTYSGGIIYDTISVSAAPIVNLGPDTSIYWTNGSVNLNAGNQGSVYYWNSILGPQTKIFNNTNLTNNDTNVVYVDIIDGFGCFASDTILIIVINDVSIDIEEPNQEISIYPNPSRGKVYVNILGMKKDCWVNLSTIDGRSIHRSKYYNGSQVMVINIENLAKGVYLLNISNKDINKTIKVIIN